MKLQFLGTGAAEGIPAVFCECEACEEIRRRGETEYHSRAQFLLDDTIGIDFPPDAYAHGLRFGARLSRLQYLLVTHSHMDHFYAHDFVLRGYKYAPTVNAPLHIYGNTEVKKVFDECTRRELRSEVSKNIRLHEIEPFVPFAFGENNAYTATPLLAQHGNKETALLYLIEKGEKTYLHLTDTGRLPKQTLDYLENYFKNKTKKLSFATFDCTFLFYEAGEISRHMGLEDNRAMQQEFDKRGIADHDTRYAITHYSHNSAPLKETLERAQKEYGYLATFDGMTVNI